MHPGHAANQREVLHQYMPRQSRHGDNNPIAQNHVVTDVTAGQDVVVGADDGGLAIAGGTVNRHAFTDGIVIPDLGARHPALPFQVLRLEPDAGKGENLVALAQPCVAVDHYV